MAGPLPLAAVFLWVAGASSPVRRQAGLAAPAPLALLEDERSLFSDAVSPDLAERRTALNAQCKVYHNVTFGECSGPRPPPIPTTSADEYRNARGAAECAVMCAWRPGCVFFSFHRAQRSCYFHKVDQKITKDVLQTCKDTCCESGTPCSVAELTAPYKAEASNLKDDIKSLKDQMVKTVRAPGGSYEGFVHNAKLKKQRGQKKEIKTPDASGNISPLERTDILKIRLAQAELFRSRLVSANAALLFAVVAVIAGGIMYRIRAFFTAANMSSKLPNIFHTEASKSSALVVCRFKTLFPDASRLVPDASRLVPDASRLDSLAPPNVRHDRSWIR